MQLTAKCSTTPIADCSVDVVCNLKKAKLCVSACLSACLSAYLRA